MSSLSNTTWTFNVTNGGTATWTFNANGFAYSGGIKLGTWVEDSNGNFMIELNFYPVQPGYMTIWTGKHANGAGNGIVSPIYNRIVRPFVMSKAATTQAIDPAHDVALAID